MKWSSLVLFLGFLGVVVAELPLAKPCDPSVCKLPACRCSSTAIPGGLAPRHTPQFVMITFDDAVNVLNIDTYRSSLYNRTNRNGCKAGATFYVNHEYTNYQLVNELYNHGFEIALHTISHKTPSSAWANATVETLRREIADQILQMAHFANVSSADVHGVRLPFLQMSGNSSFVVMQESGLSYDCSWPTMSFTNPGLWPYSLNYASTQDCIIPPCPTASIPRTWVLPMLSWRDLNGLPCSMADSCYATPPFDDENAWFKFIVTNFERQYKGNRAPFGFFVHEWFLRIHPAVYRAFTRFLNMINSLSDVFMVNSKEVLDWVRNPVPINEYLKKPCRTRPYRSCAANTCGPLASPHLPERHYWMVLCNKCPREYPWVGNPLGV